MNRGTEKGEPAMRHRRIVLPKIGTAIGCRTVGVINNPAIAGKYVNRINHLDQNSMSCLVACRPRPQGAGGFTLIEQLVVIAIISILLGILVPILQPVKNYVTKAICDNNLRNLYEGLQMYIGDNDGQFPDIIDLDQAPLEVKDALQPYVKSEKIFRCWNDPQKAEHQDGSYDWRVTPDPKTSLSGVKLNLLRYPNKVIIAGERSHGCHKSEMINVLYADGHIGQVTQGEFLINITTPLEFK